MWLVATVLDSTAIDDSCYRDCLECKVSFLTDTFFQLLIFEHITYYLVCNDIYSNVLILEKKIKIEISTRETI